MTQAVESGVRESHDTTFETDLPQINVHDTRFLMLEMNSELVRATVVQDLELQLGAFVTRLEIGDYRAAKILMRDLYATGMSPLLHLLFWLKQEGYVTHVTGIAAECTLVRFGDGISASQLIHLINDRMLRFRPGLQWLITNMNPV